MTADLKQIDLSHHAYALVGGEETRAELLSILAKKHKLAPVGNPDFFDRRYETFSIDDARELKALAETRPIHDDGKKVFVLAMNGITVEAQNALLKLLEEPGDYARFFLILPSAHLLIPTVKSRLQVVDGGETGGARYDRYVITQAKAFLAAAPKARFDIVKSLMDDIAKEKKTRQDAIDFLHALEETVHAGGVTKQNRDALEAILLAGKYATDRAPSMKMLLEYVALSV